MVFVQNHYLENVEQEDVIVLMDIIVINLEINVYLNQIVINYLKIIMIEHVKDINK